MGPRRLLQLRIEELYTIDAVGFDMIVEARVFPPSLEEIKVRFADLNSVSRCRGGPRRAGSNEGGRVRRVGRGRR
jgi:hypothetical protein